MCRARVMLTHYVPTADDRLLDLMGQEVNALVTYILITIYKPNLEIGNVYVF